MKVRRRARGIRRDFVNHPATKGVLAECDIGPRGARGLQAKLLVFDTVRSLRAFWSNALGRGDLGKRCIGAVNSLATETVDASGRRTMMVDPRYFCVIGLVKDHLSMEVISHESVHAGFCYAKRHARDQWPGAASLDEENVCYPAGRVAAAINRFLYRKGLYT